MFIGVCLFVQSALTVLSENEGITVGNAAHDVSCCVTNNSLVLYLFVFKINLLNEFIYYLFY